MRESPNARVQLSSRPGDDVVQESSRLRYCIPSPVQFTCARPCAVVVGSILRGAEVDMLPPESLGGQWEKHTVTRKMHYDIENTR